MCRIAGYLGEVQPLGALLSAPPHSLREQAKTPRELPPGTIGSDGFGVGWFVAGQAQPARFRSLLPIWVDENIDTPWWSYPPLDFVVENLLPFTVRDVRYIRKPLQPMVMVPPEDILGRGEQLRAKGLNLGVPLPPPETAPAPAVLPK